MGIYLNPGNDGFLEAVRSEIYVDKTGLIGCMNNYVCTEQKYVCVSRPRRFGKSMALKMLAAYYGCGCDSKKMFAGLKIEKDKTFEEEKKEAFIPNKEIIEEFENAMSTGGWQEVMRILKASDKLLEDTLACNESSVAEGLDRTHTEVASILTCNDENSLGCAIGLAYYSAGKDYRMVREFPTGRGFADVVFLPLPHTGKPALVVELKYDGSACTAIRQIKEKHYTQALEGYAGEILLVGINYDKGKTGKMHDCRIEKVKTEFP